MSATRTERGNVDVYLAKQEAAAVDWALPAVCEFAKDPEEAGFGEFDVPCLFPRWQNRRTVGGNLLIKMRPGGIEALRDLLYRLEEQLPDMARQDPTSKAERGLVRAAARACTKIRQAVPELDGKAVVP